MLSNAPEDTAQGVSGLPGARGSSTWIFKLSTEAGQARSAGLPAKLRRWPCRGAWAGLMPSSSMTARTTWRRAAALGIRSARSTGPEAARADLARYRALGKLCASGGPTHLPITLHCALFARAFSGFSLIFPLPRGTVLAVQEILSELS